MSGYYYLRTELIPDKKSAEENSRADSKYSDSSAGTK